MKMTVRLFVRLFVGALCFLGWLVIGLVLPFVMLIEWAFDFGPWRDVPRAWWEVGRALAKEAWE